MTMRMRAGQHRTSERGVGLVEIILAAGISVAAILATIFIMVKSTGENIKSDSTNEGWLEGASAGAEINLLMKNIVRLSPAEDLVADGDGLYVGIAPLEKEVAPADCLSGSGSVLRLTTIALKQSSERVLRAWNSASAGKDDPVDELRITFDPAKSSFGTKNPPTELFLLDQDGGSKRRYSVRSFENRDTELHPYDDLPRIGPDGKNIKFKYTAVILDNPLRPDGTPTAAPSPALSFISDSSVFASRTVVICLAKMPVGGVLKEAPTLVEIAGTQKRPLVNLGNSSRITFRKFEVDFSATKTSGRFDELPFYTTIDADKLLCLNVARFSLLLTVNEPRAKPGDPGERRVDLSRAVLLPNFMMKRAMSCD